MKKIIILFVITFTIISCENGNRVNEKSTGNYYRGGIEIREYTIDGCQYIGKLNSTQSDWCTHKGNCKNEIHKTINTL